VIEGAIAIIASVLSLLIPLAIPLFAQRWRTFAIVLGLGAVFFAWLTWDIQRAGLGDPPGEPNWIGPFLGGLMLFGFGAGSISKFVMLLARRRTGEEQPNE
jgi:hypothetical protein